MTYKICPICSSPSLKTADRCSICGAELESVPVVIEAGYEPQPALAYDHRYGETDFDESSVNWRGATYILLAVGLLAGVICLGTTAFASARLLEAVAGPTNFVAPSPALSEQLIATNTPRPTMYLPTVTEAPPTRTPTPSPVPTETPGPCIQQVRPGDSLIAVVARCGHRNLAVLDLVVQINNLSAPEMIQSGQILEIPWPTPTSDPDSEATETPERQAGAPLSDTNTLARLAAAPPTATLQPGVMWHRVASGENIISIAFSYGANVKIMSELNPQVTFSQCDFGLPTGGPNCVVQIYEGQLLRVPAPTPTATLSPTPSGSETHTPTATATFNAPTALSPGNGRLFLRDEFVTLRWVTSGTLSAGQVYRVQVVDVTTETVYEADTTELSFVLPENWQGQDARRHEFRWTVSVIDRERPQQPYFITEPRTFLWEGRGER